MLFVQPDACRAGNTFKQQRRLSLVVPQLLDKAFLEIRMVEKNQLIDNRRQSFAR
jgi:hypothetical protein